MLFRSQPGNLSVDTWYRRVATSTIDASLCEATTDAIKITVNPLQSISGSFKYYNNTETALTIGNKTLYLYNDALLSNIVKTLPVNAGSNSYSFDNLCPGNYWISGALTQTAVGAVNGTDAAQVNAWSSHPYAIEKVRYFAADLAYTSTTLINANDAFAILLNFVNDVPINTWSFWKKGETTNTASASVNVPVTLAQGTAQGVSGLVVYGLAMGDFNRSYAGGAKTPSTTLDLINSGNILAGADQTFYLPINVVNNTTLGAASLILRFPANMVDIQDVVMNTNFGTMQWKVTGDELRIGWFTDVALDLAAGEKLLTLKLKTKAAFTGSNAISFTLAADSRNELADGQYDVISNAILSVNGIMATALGIDEQSLANGLQLTNRPNPFNGITTINYTLPFEGIVTLDVYNYMGSHVSTLVSETQLQGDHSVKFDASSMSSGFYMATITVTNGDNKLKRTIKILNNR